jgi:aminoglycoside/choline kinase family phosphotransferase
MSANTVHPPERFTSFEQEALKLTVRALVEIRSAAWHLQRHIESIPQELRAYVSRIENLADSLHNSPREVLLRGPHSEEILQIEIKAGQAALSSAAQPGPDNLPPT